MKKLLALTLSLLLTFSLVGCFDKVLSPAEQTQQMIEHQAVNEETAAQVQPETQALTEAPTDAPTQAPEKTEDEKIGEEKAKKIALDHAGLKEADVKHLFVELDYDDGVLRYEVDFRQDKYEYDYDIDAKTGKILSYDKDIDD